MAAWLQQSRFVSGQVPIDRDQLSGPPLNEEAGVYTSTDDNDNIESDDGDAADESTPFLRTWPSDTDVRFSSAGQERTELAVRV